MDYTEIVIYSIGTVILVGSWISKNLKEQAGARDGSTKSPKPSGARTSLAERLAERGRQLREQAAQQGQQTSIENQPTNLTMAERIARAHAAAQYQNRAAKLQRKQPPPPGGSIEPPPTSPRTAEPPSSRTDSKRDIEQDLARRRAPRSRRQAGPDRRRVQKSPSSAGSAPISVRDRPPLREDSPVRSIPDPIVPQGFPVPVVASGHGAAVGAVGEGLRSIHALRRAIVLKEILDRPLALRDPFESTLP